MSGTGRTAAEFRRENGQTERFGTLPPFKPGVSKGIPEGFYLGFGVKFRWDRLGTDTVAGILFREEDVDAVRKLPGFEPV